MSWAMEEFKIAYEKAELILSKMDYDPNKMIPTASIIDAVENELNVDVQFADYDFRKLTDNEGKGLSYADYGAAMCIIKADDGHIARILLNNRETPEMKRFSLIHEMGHLITRPSLSEQEFKISTHIDMDITSIPDKVLKKKKYSFLIDEQIANIFALLVLIPYDMLVKALVRLDSFEKVAIFFGVEKNALVSRMWLEDARCGILGDGK